ncbi:MAG: glycosyltransferase family 1 protein [Bacteroidota bacterium]
MKIAILADPLDNQSAGVHSFTSGFVNALIKYDQDNEYVLLREKKDPGIPNHIQQIAIPNNRFLLLFSALRLFIIFPIILRQLKVDAVIEPAHFGPFNLPRHIRRINIIHDLTPIIFPRYHRWLSRHLQRFFLRHILKKAALIIAVSQSTANDLARFYPFAAPKTKVVYPGRDEFFRPMASSNKILEKYQISSPFFLTVGTIEPRKNLIFLLRTYQKFREEHVDKVLLVIIGGEGWKYQSFYDALNRHPFKDDIIMTGYVKKEDLREFYNKTVALIYPSFYEGFGLPVLEALACGTRVICSDQSSLPEVGGKTVRYFNPKVQQQLLTQLHAVTQPVNPPSKTISSSIDQAATFSWELSIAAFTEVLAVISASKTEFKSQ